MTRFMPLAIALAAAPTFAGATITAFQDTTALDRAVASFTGHAIGEEGGAATPVDTRLKLAQCATLALSWHGDTHDAVVVSCTGPDWRVFVPVRAAYVAPARAVMVGAPLAPVARPEIVIKRGDPIMIEANASGFSITREGVAMGDAPAGGRLMVKCDDAKAPVQAVALESGRATLPGWTN